MKKAEPKFFNKNLPKSPTGIQGFDEITGGGYPKADQHLSVAAQAAEKHFSEWSSLYVARLNLTNRVSLCHSKKRMKN